MIDMPKVAHVSLTQVRPGTFCVRQTSTEFRPGQSAREVWVIRIEDIPDGTTGEAITGKVARLVDPFDPPAVIAWAELAKGA